MKNMRFDAVQTIKDRLKMREVLSVYGFRPERRMRCPIHNGDDLNFSITDHSFICYSHCGGGDVITFVQKLFNLSFADALKKIDTDFNLNIYGQKTFEELRKSHYQAMQLQAKREREKAERERADAEYWAVFDEWKRLDDNSRIYAPKKPDEEWHPLFVEALQKLAYQEYLLACAEEKRFKS